MSASRLNLKMFLAVQLFVLAAFGIAYRDAVDAAGINSEYRLPGIILPLIGGKGPAANYQGICKSFT